ncbi:hypothetical protein OnM2_070032 [Erysiphe neolycopersici]|uniref:Uncharacterized protein n=1 Tax=Erysiphe neolycopersici TaxID=212602 RepID=A0A420HKI9_9PEZI|nr:hypothetical protein OnM2_070032 [Erysiphe neolycopersici]
MHVAFQLGILPEFRAHIDFHVSIHDDVLFFNTRLQKEGGFVEARDGLDDCDAEFDHKIYNIWLVLTRRELLLEESLAKRVEEHEINGNEKFLRAFSKDIFDLSYKVSLLTQELNHKFRQKNMPKIWDKKNESALTMYH